MQIPATADAVIVGGGINGGAIAYHLARAGMSDIAIFEAAALAHGASSRGAGIIRTYYHNDSEARLALLSLSTFRNWQDEIGGTCGYTPTGFLWLVGQDGVADLRATVAAQNRLGAGSEVLSPQQVVEIQPHLDPGGIGAAAYEPESGYGNPKLATEALHAAACRLGVSLYQGVRVTSLGSASGHITGVTTTNGAVSAPVVILAAGAWSAPLAATVGVEIPQVPTRMTTGTIRHSAFAAAPLTFVDTVSDTFFRPTDEIGVAHVSIRDARHNTIVDPCANWREERVARTASLVAIERLSARIPSLQATPLRAWAGIDGVTPDHRPIYGKVPDLEGLILCVGSSYKGFKVAPAVGRCLADLVTSGRSTLVDLTPFDLGRFDSSDRSSGPPGYSLSNVS